MNSLKSLALCLTTLAFAMASPAADVKGGDPALPAPVKSIYDDYLAIQKQLALDSMKGVEDHATAIAKSVRGDESKSLSPEVAKQAEAVAKAKDLKAARQAFKPLSVSLIKYLSDKKAGKGVYHEAYCPMAKAGWLQADRELKNPYYGKSMLDCGDFKN